MAYNNYFKMPGGYKKFLETSGLAEDLTGLTIRQVIKRKNAAKLHLARYEKFLSSPAKRLAFTRHLRMTIRACNDIQQQRRYTALSYYHSLPKDERVPKNWNKFVAEFSNSGHYLRKEKKEAFIPIPEPQQNNV